MNFKDQFLWTEQYRPQTVKDCILPDRIKSVFQGFVNTQNVPHLLLSGTPGCGKTTIARALGHELNADVLFINASDEGRYLDTLRSKVKQFASTVTLGDANCKIVIYDEADAMPTAVQEALKSNVEEFARNCRFVFTCNFKNKVIPPIQSRCVNVDFDFSTDDKKQMMKDFWAKAKTILDDKKIKYDDAVVAKLIQKTFPDFRKTLNELQKYSISGSIDVGILATIGNVRYDALFGYLKTKDFKQFRQWAAQHANSDPQLIYSSLFEIINDFLTPDSIPAATLILHDYQYKSASIMDPELNLTACFVELASNCKFS